MKGLYNETTDHINYLHFVHTNQDFYDHDI